MQRFFLKDPIYSEPDRNSVLLVLENNIIMRGRRKTESMMRVDSIQDSWKILNYLERQILTTIYDKGEITSDDAVKLINRSKPTAVKLLNKLIELNLIEWNGTSKTDPHGRYIIK